ncbi:hypothetical protein MAELSTROM_36 [Pseudoalteromonas phage Maelstrom]|uniref:tail sheath n=1 Tax=Pseudoalteromonas phage Maelstrom TaxID=2065202 RepID=UPI000CA24E62|nr:tail sheath [Pseudoalteromonas phage Maelstrom]AUG84956.1 hypothetical protein MAELSTROM_36 [Pseudoalteromonas phage Maelstrom]
MPISSNRYVDITSAVGGGEAVPTRELLLRLFTTNERVPTGAVLNFSSSTLETSLREYFGSASEEYKRAAYYFGFISKVATSPKNIQFARWADSNTNAQVFGSELPLLNVLNTITAGAFDIVLGGVTFNVTALDFSSDATYTDVASTLQTAIQAEGGALSSVDVSYNASRTTFDFDTNGDADGDISFVEVTAGLLDTLGFGENATFSNGIEAQTVTDSLGATTSMNNNFGSFDFIDSLTDDQIVERAVFANGRNVEFMNLQRVLTTNRTSIAALVSGYASTGLVLAPLATQYPELLPAALLASLDYDSPAASANFMYYQDSRLTPSVTTDTEADANDALEVNYYGQTQEAGTNLSFFQKGVLMGGSTAPKAMGVHANEQWLKAYLKSQFLNMFLAMQQVSADLAGQAMGMTYLDSGISLALTNGSISVGKTLKTTQINYITQLTGDSKAYLDVQSRGYWYSVVTDATNNTMDYLLVYSKRDSVDKVNGRHSLI